MMHYSLAVIRTHAEAASYFGVTDPIRGTSKAVDGVPIHLERRQGRKKVLKANDDGSYSACIYGGAAVTWHKDGRITLHGEGAGQTTVGFMEWFTQYMPFINYLSFSNSLHAPDALRLWLMPKGKSSDWIQGGKSANPTYVSYTSNMLGEPAIDGRQVPNGEMDHCPILHTRGAVTFDCKEVGENRYECKVDVNEVQMQFANLVDKTKASKARSKFVDFIQYAEFFKSVPLSIEALKPAQNIRINDVFAEIRDTPDSVEAWCDAVHFFHEPWGWGTAAELREGDYKLAKLKKSFYEALYMELGLYYKKWLPLGPQYSTAFVSDITLGDYYDKELFL